MKTYDVVIVGGAIAGPVAAKFCAQQNLKTLLVEQFKVPREKPCSGIQFPYFEKIIGDSIPPERLCNNTLTKTEMRFPNGKVLQGKFPMINFMRDTFDEWLCLLAQSYGADFWDGCKYRSFEENDDGILVILEGKNGPETIQTKYLVDGTGMRPVIRQQLRNDGGFQKGSSGAALNYYFTADGDLEPDKLYQFWNIDFNNMMFAWIYNKTLADGKDYWVVGTGYDRDITKHLDAFFDHVKDLYNLKNVLVVKKEGYSSSMIMDGEDRIWLGDRNILMVGDAAGLIDLTRGVGMDAAALSGRLAGKAIGLAEKTGKPVIEIYERLMTQLVKQTRKNQQRGIMSFQDNQELQEFLDKGVMKMGLNMLVQARLNKLRSPEKQVMIP
ncbi:MAG: NAD(P)/FAD-dependent oxidoreductase [Anaerolineales bacterium]|nr:NAD(P)/FAD-dependent oxidoreductase [Anaerolineales bacterium]